MAQGQNSQVVAYQYEKVLDRVSLLFNRDHTLFDKIEVRKNLETISSRNMRIPLDLLAGGKFSQVNADGGDFGRGSAITADFAQISSVYFALATEYTKLFEVATDNNEKAVEPAAKHNLEAAIDQMRKGIEALLNSDGSGTLDTVVSGSSASAVVTVNNPNQFYDNQEVTFWSAVGGSQRGASNSVILSVDSASKTITLTANAPASTTAGDIIVVAGGTAAAASSLLGIEYHQVDSPSTGTWLQLNRSSYPGKLTTSHVAVNGSLTPQSVRLALAKVKRALGVQTPEIDNLLWHMGPDMKAAWENVGLVVAQVIQNQLGGNESQDMLKKSAPGRMGDRPILESINAKPGRIDGLCLKHWGRAQTQPIGPLSFGGQVLFPIYGTSGGLSAATISYLWCGFNVFMDNPRAGCFLDGVTQPAGY